MSIEFQGIFPALVTPMTAAEEVDLQTLERFVDYLVAEAGVHGMIPLGSTGEFYALTPGEREAVLKTTLAVVDDRVPVLAGANAAATQCPAPPIPTRHTCSGLSFARTKPTADRMSCTRCENMGWLYP